jgi:hypothetical protein
MSEVLTVGKKLLQKQQTLSPQWFTLSEMEALRAIDFELDAFLRMPETVQFTILQTTAKISDNDPLLETKMHILKVVLAGKIAEDTPPTVQQIVGQLLQENKTGINFHQGDVSGVQLVQRNDEGHNISVNGKGHNVVAGGKIIHIINRR